MTVKHPRTAIVRGTVAIAASLLALGISRVGVLPALTQERSPRYFVVDLEPLGSGASEGRHVSNNGVVSGLSDIDGPFRRATIWIDRQPQDLGTLGGPHSAVIFTDFPHGGPIVGIAETGIVDDRREAFSCSSFFPGGRDNRTGFTCRGFVSDGQTMKALDTLGGLYSFAAGANTKGEVVGWAQTLVEDPGCVDGTIHQFLPVIWDARTGGVKTTLPTFGDDRAGSAVAINNRGQVVGISGDCDQAVGRRSARHAIIWNNGTPTDIGNLGADTWNTPVAINEHGDVVGFAGIPNGDQPVQNFGAFYWTTTGGMQALDRSRRRRAQRSVGDQQRPADRRCVLRCGLHGGPLEKRPGAEPQHAGSARVSRISPDRAPHQRCRDDHRTERRFSGTPPCVPRRAARRRTVTVLPPGRVLVTASRPSAWS